jgi:hypothetical protein
MKQRIANNINNITRILKIKLLGKIIVRIISMMVNVIIRGVYGLAFYWCREICSVIIMAGINILGCRLMKRLIK